MKATTKKLLISTFVLVIAIALATSTTYAWFAMNTTPEIREFSVDITAGDNLLIAVTERGVEAPDQALFKSYIATSEITGNGIEDDPNEFGKGQFFNLSGAVVENATSLTTATSTNGQTFLKEDGVLLAGEGAYYAFDVHFIGSAAFNIQLNTGTAVTSAQTSTNNFPAYYWEGNTFGGTAGEPIIAAASNAVRIAFVKDFNAGTPAASFKIYEPNSGAGFGNYGGNSTDNLAIAYYNYMLEANISQTGTQTVFTSLATTLLTLTEIQAGDPLAGTGVFTGTFTVVLWLEGWDADAFDSVKNQTIATVLNFTGVTA